MVHFYLKYRSNKVDSNKMHYFSKYVPAVNIVCKFENYCFNSFGLAISVKFVSGLFSSPLNGTDPFKIIFKNSEVKEDCKTRTRTSPSVESFKN